VSKHRCTLPQKLKGQYLFIKYQRLHSLTVCVIEILRRKEFCSILIAAAVRCESNLIYRIRQKILTIFKLQYIEKYTIFLREFIAKIIFIWKHFNYNIHFMNIVSVRWRPLLSEHSRKRRTSDKSLTQSFDVLSSAKWRLSSWTFSFCVRLRFSAVSHSQQCSIATRDTVVPINIEVPKKY
jgi:hypothetical protein